MPKMPEPPAPAPTGEIHLDLSHLRREARTALELALIALAPVELTDRLASAAGLLEALTEVPEVGVSGHVLLRTTVDRARGALGAWHDWEQSHFCKG